MNCFRLQSLLPSFQKQTVIQLLFLSFCAFLLVPCIEIENGLVDIRGITGMLFLVLQFSCRVQLTILSKKFSVYFQFIKGMKRAQISNFT